MKYYDFRFGDDNAGWFEILEGPDRIWMKAVFGADGEDYENEFELRLADGKVAAYRYGAGEIVRIDWGGPVSHLHDPRESAQAGSKYEAIP